MKNYITPSIAAIFCFAVLAQNAHAKDDFTYPPTLDNGSIRFTKETISPLGVKILTHSYYNCRDLNEGKRLTPEFLGRLDNGYHALEGKNIYNTSLEEREIALQESAKRFQNTTQGQSHINFMHQQLAQYDRLSNVGTARSYLTEQNIPSEKWQSKNDNGIVNYARSVFLLSKLKGVHQITGADLTSMIANCQP